jgi:DNA-binding MurR/RpiR family transcriptional regulator
VEDDGAAGGTATDGAQDDLTGRIRSGMATFSPAERRVARLILTGTPTIGLESSARLAREAHVSGPTVVRFANRLGFATYAGFQDALRRELDARVVSPLSLYRTHQSEAAEPDELLTSGGRALADATWRTFCDIPPDEFWSACRLLGVDAARVVAFGGWFSHIHAR